MSFSIIARCTRSGRLGIAMASPRLAGGIALEASILRGVGGILVQGPPNPRLNRLGVNLLAQGWSPKVVLQTLRAEDEQFDTRQVAIVDRENRLAISSPGEELRTFGEGTGVAVLAEGARSDSVASAMMRSFEAGAAKELDARLLAALEAGEATAADALCSGAMVVWGTLDYSELDLRVDAHATPVQELRRVYADFKPTAEFYEARARNPRMTMNAREFAGILETRKATSP